MAIQDLPTPQQTSAPMSETMQFENAQDEKFDLGELLSVLYRRRWVLLIGLLTVFGLGMVYTLTRQPIYQSSCSLLVITSANRYSRADDLPLLTDLQALTKGRSVDTQVEILSSYDLLNEAYKGEFANSVMTPEDRTRGFKSEMLPGWAPKISAKKDTDIITITVQAYTPDGAAHFANNIAQAYLNQDLVQNRQATKQARIFVETRLASTLKEFDKANRALAEFKRKTGLVSPNTQIGQMASNLATLQLSLDNTNTDSKANKKSLESLQQQFSSMQAEIISNTAISRDPRFSECLIRLGHLNSDRARLLYEYTEQSPEVLAIDAQIANEESALRRLTQQTIVSGQSKTPHPIRQELLTKYANGLATDAANSARAQALSAELAARKNEIKQLPAQERRLADLTMALELQKDMVDLLSQKYQTLQISEESTLSNVRVISQARPSGAPVFPRKNTNAAMFLMLGIICGVGLAFLIERLDDRIHNQEVAEKLTGLVTMGSVHHIEEDEPKVISTDDQRSQLLERFRVLRNNITFSSLERKVRLLAITSAGPGEGKSTCSTNLGIAMALDGKRVLIVDCDLHRPSIHTLLKTPRHIGFSNVVLGAVSLEEAIVKTEYPGLELLPAGTLPPNPSEILNAKPSRQLFEELAGKYDLVVLDCPPCLKLSDVQVISTIVDGVLLLVAANQTLKQGLSFAYHALAQVSAPLIGMVINRVNLYQHGYGYYRYYSKYGYYRYYHYDYYENEDDATAANPVRNKRRRRNTTEN